MRRIVDRTLAQYLIPRVGLIAVLVAHASAPVAFPFARQSVEKTDPEFEAEMNAAWADVRRFQRLINEGNATDDENPQAKFAAKFFSYYLKHPVSQTGRDAADSAFMMWGNIGKVDAIEKALPQINPASEVWLLILSSIGNAYWRKDRVEDYYALLHRLEAELTSPESQAELALRIGRHYLQRDDTDQARSYFEKVHELGVSAFFADRARRGQYELDRLGVGQMAPDFTAKDIDGNTVRLSDFRGQVVLLDFWATWCGPCLPEVPYLAEIHRAHGNGTVQIIGVSLDTKLDALREFIEEHEMDWPEIVQDKKWKGALSKLYAVDRIPRTFLINKEGRIAAKGLRKKSMVETVEQLLNSQK